MLDGEGLPPDHVAVGQAVAGEVFVVESGRVDRGSGGDRRGQGGDQQELKNHLKRMKEFEHVQKWN